MAEADPLPDLVPDDTSGDDVPRAADIEMGPDGLESMDESFLEALPADLRQEMMQAQADMVRRSSASAQAPAQPRAEPDQASAMSQDDQPAETAAPAAAAPASAEQSGEQPTPLVVLCSIESLDLQTFA